MESGYVTYSTYGNCSNIHKIGMFVTEVTQVKHLF